jgi:hypothetical protein
MWGFGDKLKLKSFVGWGNSSDPKSKHFNDQSEMYQRRFKDVCFYTKDEKTEAVKYHPGE